MSAIKKLSILVVIFTVLFSVSCAIAGVFEDEDTEYIVLKWGSYVPTIGTSPGRLAVPAQSLPELQTATTTQSSSASITGEELAPTATTTSVPASDPELTPIPVPIQASVVIKEAAIPASLARTAYPITQMQDSATQSSEITQPSSTPVISAVQVPSASSAPVADPILTPNPAPLQTQAVINEVAIPASLARTATVIKSLFASRMAGVEKDNIKITEITEIPSGNKNTASTYDITLRINDYELKINTKTTTTLTSFININTGKDYMMDMLGQVNAILNPKTPVTTISGWRVEGENLILEGAGAYNFGTSYSPIKIDLADGTIEVDAGFSDAIIKVRQDIVDKKGTAFGDVHIDEIFMQNNLPQISLTASQFVMTYSYNFSDQALQLRNFSKIGSTSVNIISKAQNYVKNVLRCPAAKVKGWQPGFNPNDVEFTLINDNGEEASVNVNTTTGVVTNLKDYIMNIANTKIKQFNNLFTGLDNASGALNAAVQDAESAYRQYIDIVGGMPPAAPESDDSFTENLGTIEDFRQAASEEDLEGIKTNYAAVTSAGVKDATSAMNGQTPSIMQYASQLKDAVVNKVVEYADRVEKILKVNAVIKHDIGVRLNADENDPTIKPHIIISSIATDGETYIAKAGFSPEKMKLADSIMQAIESQGANVEWLTSLSSEYIVGTTDARTGNVSINIFRDKGEILAHEAVHSAFTKKCTSVSLSINSAYPPYMPYKPIGDPSDAVIMPIFLSTLEWREVLLRPFQDEFINSFKDDASLKSLFDYTMALIRAEWTFATVQGTGRVYPFVFEEMLAVSYAILMDAGEALPVYWSDKGKFLYFPSAAYCNSDISYFLRQLVEKNPGSVEILKSFYEYIGLPTISADQMMKNVKAEIEDDSNATKADYDIKIINDKPVITSAHLWTSTDDSDLMITIYGAEKVNDLQLERSYTDDGTMNYEWLGGANVTEANINADYIKQTAWDTFIVDGKSETRISWEFRQKKAYDELYQQISTDEIYNTFNNRYDEQGNIVSEKVSELAKVENYDPLTGRIYWADITEIGYTGGKQSVKTVTTITTAGNIETKVVETWSNHLVQDKNDPDLWIDQGLLENNKTTWVSVVKADGGAWLQSFESTINTAELQEDEDGTLNLTGRNGGEYTTKQTFEYNNLYGDANNIEPVSETRKAGEDTHYEYYMGGITALKGEIHMEANPMDSRSVRTESSKSYAVWRENEESEYVSLGLIEDKIRVENLKDVNFDWRLEGLEETVVKYFSTFDSDGNVIPGERVQSRIHSITKYDPVLDNETLPVSEDWTETIYFSDGVSIANELTKKLNTDPATGIGTATLVKTTFNEDGTTSEKHTLDISEGYVRSENFICIYGDSSFYYGEPDAFSFIQTYQEEFFGQFNAYEVTNSWNSSDGWSTSPSTYGASSGTTKLENIGVSATGAEMYKDVDEYRWNSTTWSRTLTHYENGVLVKSEVYGETAAESNSATEANRAALIDMSGVAGRLSLQEKLASQQNALPQGVTKTSEMATSANESSLAPAVTGS